MPRKQDKKTAKADIYTRVTNRIIEDLEKGVRPWQRPWSVENTAGKIMRPLRHNGEPYSGINVLALWCAAADQGFQSPTWMTFRQAKELGAHVRKGEKASSVVYANKIIVEEENADGETDERQIPYLKQYSVFNTEQIDGLPERYRLTPEPQLTPVERIESAEAFVAATGADIRYRGSRAFYAAGGDYIQMPPIEAFRDAESFYATLLHESVHRSGHPSRLNRDFGRKRWGDEGYAREELTAELGAAFLCADLEITPEIREDHAAYLASWLKILQNEKRAIFQAAAHAQRAADYLHSLQPKEPAEPLQAPVWQAQTDQTRQEATR